VEKILLPTRQEAIDPNGPAWLSKRSSHRDYNPHLSCIPLGHQCLFCCWLHFQFWPTPRALSSFQPSNGMSFGRERRKSSMSGSKNSLKGKFTANPPYYPYLWCALKSSKKTWLKNWHFKWCRNHSDHSCMAVLRDPSRSSHPICCWSRTSCETLQGLGVDTVRAGEVRASPSKFGDSPSGRLQFI